MPYNFFAYIPWTRLLVLILGLAILSAVFNAAMRNVLNVKKRKAFGRQYVNEAHKEWDGIIIIFFVIAFLLFILFLGMTGYHFPLFSLLPLIIPVTSAILQAYMEWQHGGGKKEAIYTLSEMGFILLTAAGLSFLLFPEFFT